MSQVIYANPPERCETCGADFNGVLYDARTKLGPWACMCGSCFALGPGAGQLGPGWGQRYSYVEGKGFVKNGG